MDIVYKCVGKFIVDIFTFVITTGLFGIAINILLGNYDIDNPCNIDDINYAPFYIGGIIYIGVINVLDKFL